MNQSMNDEQAVSLSTTPRDPDLFSHQNLSTLYLLIYLIYCTLASGQV
jgi:hypothetical protein